MGQSTPPPQARRASCPEGSPLMYHIFDVSIGYDERSVMSSSTSIQNAKKINMYNSMTQVLLGYTANGDADHINEFVERFESDFDLSDNNRLMTSVFFINFSRLLTKDQIKKGSFSITLATGSWEDAATAGQVKVLADYGATADQGFKTVVGGEYGLLYTASSDIGTATGQKAVGNIFYQAGIAVITSSLFQQSLEGGVARDSIETLDQDFSRQRGDLVSSAKTLLGCFTGSAISASCNALRHRISNIAFNNTTEINSKIYFCRVPWNKFNYSTNPTYISGGAIVVKQLASDVPISYITTVGMYNPAGELMATAKLSEPLRKDPTNELTLRVRLDY